MEWIATVVRVEQQEWKSKKVTGATCVCYCKLANFLKINVYITYHQELQAVRICRFTLQGSYFSGTVYKTLRTLSLCMWLAIGLPIKYFTRKTVGDHRKLPNKCVVAGSSVTVHVQITVFKGNGMVGTCSKNGRGNQSCTWTTCFSELVNST
jgi:hypothetical protein